MTNHDNYMLTLTTHSAYNQLEKMVLDYKFIEGINELFKEEFLFNPTVFPLTNIGTELYIHDFIRNLKASDKKKIDPHRQGYYSLVQCTSTGSA